MPSNEIIHGERGIQLGSLDKLWNIKPCAGRRGRWENMCEAMWEAIGWGLLEQEVERNGDVCLAGHGGQCRELHCPGNSRSPCQEPDETDDDVLWNFWRDLIDTSVR